MLQNSADPETRCLRVGPHSDLAPLNILGLQLTEFNAVADAMMLKPPGYRGREKDVRLAERLRLEERDNRQFARIISIFADHRFEAIMRSFRPAEVEFDQGRGGPSLLQGHGHRVIGKVDAQCDWPSGRQSHRASPCFELVNAERRFGPHCAAKASSGLLLYAG